MRQTKKDRTVEMIQMGSITIASERRDKVFFPDAGITKGDVVDYYHWISEMMLPHVRDRAVSMKRFPDGIREDGFYQKEAPDHFPDWVVRETLENRDGGRTTYVVIDRSATLVYLAEQGTITPHVWLSTIDRPEEPDRMIFDLDPPDGDFSPVRDAARLIRDTLQELEIPSYVMTTGSTGLHVVTPLRRSTGFDYVREFASGVAELAALRHPDTLTTEQRKAGRRGRLFLDVMRNAYGQTGVPPYALRARAGAPVAAPIEWKELADGGMTSERYSIDSIRRRLGQRDDPWKGIGRHAVSLGGRSERLEELLRRARST